MSHLVSQGHLPGQVTHSVTQDSELLELWTESSLVNTAVTPALWRGGVVWGSGQTEAQDGYVSGNSGSGRAII